jgi:hypothetical protein
MALLALLTAVGYPDSVFGVATLFLVGMPTVAIVAMLIPVTMVFEILRSLFPSGYRTLLRAFQMLLTAFFGILFFAVILLVFPPQNPVTFLFVVPIVIALALGVGFGLVRVNPEMFLRTPVIIGMAALLLVTLGLMSMPNLRQKIANSAKIADRMFVGTLEAVEFASSKDIDFTKDDGTVKLWYVERPAGGFDLFRNEGVGPYYSKDGRKLQKAENEGIRQRISAWVDQVAAEKATVQRKVEAERTARVLAQQVEDKKRQAEESAKAEQARRAGYLSTPSLPARVEFIVCAATGTKEPFHKRPTAFEK